MNPTVHRGDGRLLQTASQPRSLCRGYLEELHEAPKPFAWTHATSLLRQQPQHCKLRLAGDEYLTIGHEWNGELRRVIQSIPGAGLGGIVELMSQVSRIIGVQYARSANIVIRAQAIIL